MDIDYDDENITDNSSIWNGSLSDEDSESENDDIEIVRVWCKHQSSQVQPAPPAFPFSGSSGLKVPTTDFDDPVNIFNHFFDDELIEYIVTETNRYADNFLETNELTPSARAQNWKETNGREMRLFLAILIYMGIVQKPVEEWYWSKRQSICTPFVSEIMSYRRFQLLMKFLHFTNNETFDIASHPQPKLKKIFEIFQITCRKFQEVYIPEKDITVDESLVPYKGRLGYKQYIPSKRARFGVKMYELCESHSGYIWNMICYTGKDTPFHSEYKKYGSTTACVMTLAHDLLNKGYCLSLDNFYTSPELAELLIAKKTDVYGTIRPTRKNLPPAMKNEKLQRGKTIAFQKGKMCVLKWQDKKPVCILSTIHNSENVEIKSRNKTVLKPKAIADYNLTMGGVDKSDQCISYYPAIRNQQKKYYKKLFRHLLDQVIWNSFVLYQKTGGTLRHLEFRMKLVEGLVQSNKEPNVSHKNLGKNPGSILRLTARHFPSNVPSTEQKTNRTRRCVVCSNIVDENGKRKRRESRYQCEICNVGLCVTPCFEKYHTYEHF